MPRSKKPAPDVAPPGGDRLIEVPQLCEKLGGISRSTLEKWLRDPNIQPPLPRPLGLQRNRQWSERAIDAWIADHQQLADAAA